MILFREDNTKKLPLHEVSLIIVFFLFFSMNRILPGQTKAELEEKRKKTLEEINYVDNLLKTTAKEKSEGMNAVKIIGRKLDLRESQS